MLERTDYIIRISSLKRGENFYKLRVNKELFENFDCQEAEDITCLVDIKAIRRERWIEFYFDFKGSMDLICSRCLSKLVMPIRKQTVLYVKFGQEYAEPDDNEIIIPENQNELDLLSYIYEELRLELPISPVHSTEEECDKEMIDILLAKETESMENKEDFDPRWAKLKELIK
ncbi:MAG: YceD family protein [Bacteroidota bacterium]|nr:YceD family protein [Bacteroidota bacterium]